MPDVHRTALCLCAGSAFGGCGCDAQFAARLGGLWHFDSATALRKVHEAFVDIWAQALRQSSAALPETKITSLARTAHALSYGWYSHDLLFYFDDPQHSRSIEEIATAIVDLVKANSRG